MLGVCSWSVCWLRHSDVRRRNSRVPSPVILWCWFDVSGPLQNTGLDVMQDLSSLYWSCWYLPCSAIPSVGYLNNSLLHHTPSHICPHRDTGTHFSIAIRSNKCQPNHFDNQQQWLFFIQDSTGTAERTYRFFPLSSILSFLSYTNFLRQITSVFIPQTHTHTHTGWPETLKHHISSTVTHTCSMSCFVSPQPCLHFLRCLRWQAFNYLICFPLGSPSRLLMPS